MVDNSLISKLIKWGSYNPIWQAPVVLLLLPFAWSLDNLRDFITMKEIKRLEKDV